MINNVNGTDFVSEDMEKQVFQVQFLMIYGLELQK